MLGPVCNQKMASSSDQCMSQFTEGLKYDLPTRCAKIMCISEEYSSKELHNIFPILVEDIFGVTLKYDWGLRSTYLSNHYDGGNYQILRDFFGSEGPFFNLCYKLMSNNFYLKYDFPLTFLPVSVKKMIDDGIVSTFYSKFLKIDTQTGKPTALSLNPFEFYIFHFAYHLVNPCIQRNSGCGDMWDTAYLMLADQYMSYFLSCRSDSPVPPLTGFYMTKSPTPLQPTNRPVRLPTLFRQSVLVSQSNTSSSLHTSTNSSLQNAWLEIWRSELIAQVFLDFWFSSAAPINRSNMPEQFQYASPVAPSMTLNQSSMLPIANLKNPLSFCYPQLPSTEHMRVVRTFLKHMHFFANSYTNNGTAFDELKRLIIPSSQSKIYTFLRRTIDQWPLDTSFRVILETWLSFIQPWRYSNYYEQKDPVVREEEDRVVDAHWMGFVAENLLAYTVVFRQVVNRFTRLDLTTPKNAAMVGRITKIFAQTNLCPMIAEAESCIDEQIVPHKWTALIRQQIVELEGPGYHYTPLFGLQTEIEIKRFLQYLRESLRAAQALLLHDETEVSKHSQSAFSGFLSWFSSGEKESGDYTLQERKKVVLQLRLAIAQLSTLFKVELPDLTTTTSFPNTSQMDETSIFSDSTGLGDSTVCHEPQPDSTMRTPIRDSPKAMRERIRQVRYEGDPDLEPIRSTENTLLVRLLYQVTCKLNEMYSTEMETFYYREDLVGRIARQILCPPKTIRRYDKSFPGGQSPRVESTLPPRLSFRSLAGHRFLAYYLVAIVIAYAFDYGPVSFTLILVAAWALFVVIYAVAVPWLDWLSRLTQSLCK